MSPVIIAWTIIAFVGVLVSTAALGLALADFLSIGGRGAPILVRQLATDNARREAIRLAAHMLNFVVGALILLDVAAGVAVFVLVGSVLAHIGNSALDLRRRILLSRSEVPPPGTQEDR